MLLYKLEPNVEGYNFEFEVKKNFTFI